MLIFLQKSEIKSYKSVFEAFREAFILNAIIFGRFDLSDNTRHRSLDGGGFLWVCSKF